MVEKITQKESVLKIVACVLKWLLIVLASVVILVLACWWLLPDEALLPEAEKLLTARGAPPAVRNGYFLLWGMRASPGQDAHAVGQIIVAEHDKLIAAGGDLANFKAESFLGPTPLLTASLGQRLCDIEKQKCLAVYQGARTQIETDLDRHKVYLERYRALRSYPEFAEVMSFTSTSPMPEFVPVTRMSDLADAAIAIQVASPETREAAVNELAAEIALWKRLLRDSDMLLTQMVSVALLQRKYRLASEIMNTYPEALRDYPARMAELTQPLPLRDATLVRALRGEFRFAASSYRNIKSMGQIPGADDASGIGKLVDAFSLAGSYRPNATINRAYGMYQENAKLYAQPPKEVLAGHAQLKERHNDIDAWTPDTIVYNPTGKVLTGIAAADFSTYAFRLHDLAGLSRLIDIQRRVAEGSLSSERMTEFLASLDADQKDPYTGKPMEWNAKDRTISFAGHGNRFLKDGRMQVEVGGK